MIVLNIICWLVCATPTGCRKPWHIWWLKKRVLAVEYTRRNVLVIDRFFFRIPQKDLEKCQRRWKWYVQTLTPNSRDPNAFLSFSWLTLSSMWIRSFLWISSMDDPQLESESPGRSQLGFNTYDLQKVQRGDPAMATKPQGKCGHKPPDLGKGEMIWDLLKLLRNLPR